MKKYELAKWLHDNYESLAKEKNWQTQDKCKVEFDDLPSENKELMLSLADRLADTFLIIDDQANVMLSVARVNKYGRHQFNRGSMKLDLVSFEDWQH